MNAIRLEARAKINLSLDVLGKKPDGYHELKMIMQSIRLHDSLTLSRGQEELEVTSSFHGLPTGTGNIAYRAAALLCQRYGIKEGLHIHIEKHIPIAAGLAGGSTDAAAVIRGMNRLFSLNLQEEEMMELGKELGADVPFCIRGGTCLAEGIGEILTPLPAFRRVPLVLVKPPIGVSTAWVYRNLQLDRITERPDTDMLLNAMAGRRLEELASGMRNVLETVTVEAHPIIRQIKDSLVEQGALGSMMSGSGPSVFGIFQDLQQADFAYRKFRKQGWRCFLTQTC